MDAQGQIDRGLSDGLESGRGLEMAAALPGWGDCMSEVLDALEEADRRLARLQRVVKVWAWVLVGLAVGKVVLLCVYG